VAKCGISFNLTASVAYSYRFVFKLLNKKKKSSLVVLSLEQLKIFSTPLNKENERMENRTK